MPRTLIALLVLLPLVAHGDPDQDRARRLSRSGEILPLERLLPRVVAGRNLRVLEVELEEKHGRLIYEMELLDADGRVLEIEVDARSGEVIEEKIER